MWQQWQSISGSCWFQDRLASINSPPCTQLPHPYCSLCNCHFSIPLYFWKSGLFNNEICLEHVVIWPSSSTLIHLSSFFQNGPKTWILLGFSVTRWQHWISVGLYLFALFLFSRVWCHTISFSIHCNAGNGRRQPPVEREEWRDFVSDSVAELLYVSWGRTDLSRGSCTQKSYILGYTLTNHMVPPWLRINFGPGPLDLDV